MERNRSGYTCINEYVGIYEKYSRRDQNGISGILEKGLKENPLKCEYFLPAVVSDLLAEDRAAVKVLESEDKWHGVTYKEDKPVVVEAIQSLKDSGLYPQHLWD